MAGFGQKPDNGSYLFAIERTVQGCFASALIQALLRQSDAAQARKVDEDFTLPVY